MLSYVEDLSLILHIVKFFLFTCLFKLGLVIILMLLWNARLILRLKQHQFVVLEISISDVMPLH